LDGIPDGWELDNGLNPLFDVLLKDYDGDGATNLSECHTDTNPWDSNDFPPIPYDMDADNDLDGLDLSVFVQDFNNGLLDETDLAEFAAIFWE